MLIRITDGTTTQTLAAGSARGIGVPVGPEARINISAPVNAQVREFLRAEAASASHRGNRRTGLSFAVRYQFGSIAAAQRFAVTWGATVLRSDTVVIECDDGTLVTISGAVLLDPVCEQDGVGVRVSYTISGGPQVVTEPSSYQPNLDDIPDLDRLPDLEHVPV